MTSRAPIEPPPPLLFSTTSVCPSATFARSATTRATMSVVPPGANGTISRTGLAGYVCAATHGAKPATGIAATSVAMSVLFFIDQSPGRLKKGARKIGHR